MNKEYGCKGVPCRCSRAQSRATEEQQNNHQVDQAARIKVAQIDLDWQNKGELFLAR